MKKFSFALLFLSSSALALGEYFSVSRSTRAHGMGGAFYGLSDDEYALFYNPAGLSLFSDGPQGMVSFRGQVSPSVAGILEAIQGIRGNSQEQLIVDLSSSTQGVPQFVGVTFSPFYVRKHFAVTLLAPDVKGEILITGTGADTVADIVAISDAGLVLGYGTQVATEGLFVGANLKGLYRVGGSHQYTVREFVTGGIETDPAKLGGGGFGVDFDLGVTYELPVRPFDSSIRFSTVLSNLLGSNFAVARILQEAPPGLVRMLTFAGNWRFKGVWIFDHFDFVVDFAEFSLGGELDPLKGARTGGFTKHVNFGFEAPFLEKLFALRFGFHQGYPTVGVGLNSRFFKLDFAAYQEELFSQAGSFGSPRIDIRVAFGFGAPPAAVEPQTETKSATQDKPAEPTPASLIPGTDTTPVAEPETKKEGSAPVPAPAPSP